MPIAISYEIICALERRPPSSEYLLFDDQPASTMPYTPSDEIARMKRKPIGIGAIAMSIVPHCESHGAPYGITAHVSSAGMNDITGARMNSGRYACARVRLFLHDVLHAVGDRLQQSVRPDAIRPAAILDERADAALGPDHHHHADHVDREDRRASSRRWRGTTRTPLSGGGRCSSARCGRRPRPPGAARSAVMPTLPRSRSPIVRPSQAERVVAHSGELRMRARRARRTRRSRASSRSARPSAASRSASTNQLGRAKPGAAFACRNRCTRPRRLVNVPSSSVKFAIGSTTAAACRAHARQRRADDDDRARLRDVRRVDASQLFVGDDRARRRRRGRRAASSLRLKPSSSAPRHVRRAILAQRRDPRRRRAALRRPARRGTRRAAGLLHELGEQEERFVRQIRRREHERLLAASARCAASATATCQSVPASAVAATHHRHVDAILPVHPAVVQATVVAHEVLVHVLVRARAKPHDDVVARLDDHVAALRAVRADRRRAIELPRARLVQRVLGEQRAHRAEIDDVARPRVREVLPLELADARRDRRAR